MTKVSIKWLVILIILFIGLGFLINSLLLKTADDNSSSHKSQGIDSKVGFRGLISPEDFLEKMNTNEYVVLDVRTLEEYQAQRIGNKALLVDFYDNAFKAKLNELPKDTKYLLHCRSGSRSAKAARIMQDLGFENFYELQGGIKNWTAAGLPTFSGE